MFCKKCERESPEGSKVCQYCKEPFGEEAPRKSGFPLLPVLSVVTVIVLVLLAYWIGFSHRKVDLLRAPIPPANSNVAQAPNQPVNNQLTQGVNNPNNGQLASGQSVQPTAPPKDVIDYLAKLQAIEEARKRVMGDSDFVKTMLQSAYNSQLDAGSDNNGNPSKQTLESYHGYIAQLQNLAGQVRTLQTPKSCLSLANTYLGALQAHISQIQELRTIVEKQDLTKAMNMQNTVVGPYNEALSKADDELDKVCKATGAEKKFTISD